MQTLQKMRDLSASAVGNPEFLAWLFAHVLGSSEDIEQWLRRNFVYRPESVEILRSPEFQAKDYETLGYIEGDCDDVSIMAAAMLRACDYPARFVAVRGTEGNENFDHVFIEFIDSHTGEWRIMDITAPEGEMPKQLERMELYA